MKEAKRRGSCVSCIGYCTEGNIARNRNRIVENATRTATPSYVQPKFEWLKDDDTRESNSQKYQNLKTNEANRINAKRKERKTKKRTTYLEDVKRSKAEIVVKTRNIGKEEEKGEGDREKQSRMHDCDRTIYNNTTVPSCDPQ